MEAASLEPCANSMLLSPGNNTAAIFLYRSGDSHYVLLRYWSSDQARSTVRRSRGAALLGSLGNEIKILKVLRKNWKRSAYNNRVAIAALGSPSGAQRREKRRTQSITMLPESSPRIYTDVSVDPFVRGFLHRPEKPHRQGLVLTHGADRIGQAPLLLAMPQVLPQRAFLCCAAICRFVRIGLTGRGSYDW